MNSLITFFIRQRLFGDLLCIFIVVLGVLGLALIKREVFPNVQFDIITISSLYPGASPQEVEKLVTNPIEQDLKEVDGIKKLTSVSAEGRSYVVAQLDPDQTTEAKAKDDIKDVIDRFERPDGVEEPKVQAIETKQSPIIEVAISSDLPPLELRSIAKELEIEIESVAGVAKVAYKGLRNREIRVAVDPAKLVRYRMSLDEIIAALRAQNRSIPAGSIDPPAMGEFEKIVRTVGEFEDIKDIEKAVVRANEIGRAIRISDVATVTLDQEEPTIINRTNGKPSLSLTVLKKETADAINVVEAVRTKVLAFDAQLQEQLKAAGRASVDTDFLNDFSMYIKRRVSVLGGNLAVGMTFIFFTLILFMPWRVAAIVVVGVLLSFLGTMGIFYYNDYSLNLISLLGLIIVSGMLVDDAVVVTDNYIRYKHMGKSNDEAAVLGTREIWPAVTASVLTTVVAFLPMMFMSGIFGKFTRQIPLGVVIALLFSLAEGLLILPQHLSHYVRDADFILRPGSYRARFENFWQTRIAVSYEKTVRLFLANKYKTVALFGLFFVALTALAAIKNTFVLFPADGIEIFFVKAKAPTGTSLDHMAEIMKPIEKAVMELPSEELEDVSTAIGIVQQDPNDPNTKRGSEYAQLVIYLSPESDRTRKAKEIIESLRTKIGLPDNLESLTFDRVSNGPPVGKAVSLGVRGRLYEDIMPAVAALKEVVASIPGTSDVSDSFIKGKREIHINVKPELAASSGLNVTSVGTTVRAAIEGIKASDIQELDEQVDIKVTFKDDVKTNERILSKIMIPNQRGNLVPLKNIASFTETDSISVYEHDNNTREVKVTANVDEKNLSATDANNKIRELLPELQKKFPKVSFAFGGEDEDTKESFQSLGRAFLIAFLAIFFILILTFKSVIQPFLVVLTIPSGIMAVVIVLWLRGMPLSFLAMLGVIALAGVIVNNAIVLIDFVNREREQGVGKIESIIAAATTRLRPIFLTTFTTVAGLLPTAHGIGGKDPFVVPIVTALGYGLLIGALITLFFFPLAISILDDVISLLFRKTKANATPL